LKLPQIPWFRLGEISMADWPGDTSGDSEVEMEHP
jgi:hypothetical protein